MRRSTSSVARLQGTRGDVVRFEPIEQPGYIAVWRRPHEALRVVSKEAVAGRLQTVAE